MRFFKRKRNIIIIAVILLILVFIICSRRAVPLPVSLSDVKIDRIDDLTRGDGTLEARVDVSISSDIMGKCMQIFVEEGDKVKKGDKLLKIDDTSKKAQLLESEAALNSAKQNYEYKKYVFENRKKLYEDSLLSYGEFNLSQLEFKTAEAGYAAAKTAYEIAQDNLSKTMIVSPINGIVSAIYVEEGENIITGTMNNTGTVLMTVSDNNEMIVKTEVDETAVADVMKGNPADITFDAYPDTTYRGTVIKSSIKPLVSSASEATMYEVEILLEGDYTGLLSGMNCNVSIITKSIENALTVPIQALVSRENKEGVFMVENSRAKFMPVTTGIAGMNSVEILEGEIKEGDQVVTGPFTTLKRLKNNDRVIVGKPSGRDRFDTKQ